MSLLSPDLIVVAFDTTPAGTWQGQQFCKIYERQVAFCALRTTAAEPPPWLITADGSGPVPACFTGCDSASFAGVIGDDDDEDVEEQQVDGDAGAPLTFRLGNALYAWSWSSLLVADPAGSNDTSAVSTASSGVGGGGRRRSGVPASPPTLAVVSAPLHVARRWAARRRDVRVVPGSHAHRLYSDRLAGLQARVRAARPGSTFVVPLSSLFPVLVSDNVRRLNERVVQLDGGCSSVGDLLVEITVPLDPAAAGSSVEARSRLPHTTLNDIVVVLVAPPRGEAPQQQHQQPLVLRMAQGGGATAEFIDGCLALAPVGARDSGTHVSGAWPEEGLPAQAFSDEYAWLASDSGLVGAATAASSGVGGEQPLGCVFVGRLLHPLSTGVLAVGRTPLTLADLALRPQCMRLSTPIIVIGGTSAEVGKTTLTAKLIAILAQRGLRVAAIKATGTGGLEDSRAHRTAGAFFVADQVDAGMATTYAATPAQFATTILTSFLAAQDAGADVIMCESGGDLLWANNPALLQANWLLENLVRVLIIASDALAAYGVAKYTSEKHAAAASKARLVASPFRNFVGMKRRFAALGLTEPLDCNQPAAIADMLVEAMAAVKKK